MTFFHRKLISRRILIVSSHPLFGKGLRKLLQERYGDDVVIVGMIASVDEAVHALETTKPNLVIVDYDDEKVNRDEFLALFVSGARQLRVVMLSLKEGGSEAIVYDRRKLAAAQMDEWMKEWSFPESAEDTSTETFAKDVGSDNIAVVRSSTMKHFIAVAFVVVLLFSLLYFGMQQVDLLPVGASTQSIPIDRLFNLHFILIVSLFSLIVGFMVYSIVMFRRKRGDNTDGPHIEGSTPLEVTWTVIPLLTVIAISFIGAQTLGDIGRADPRPLEVEVIGQQWSWRFEYPEWGIVTNELYLPVNQQVALELSSTDVIHSFWVPEFRVKQDALPGGEEMVRTLRVTPNRIGDYKVRCAEMCGSLHYDMESPVHVVSREDFNAWVEANDVSVSDDPVARGQQVATQFGCLACHSTDGTASVGPTWKNVFGEEVTLADGTKVLADEKYILESIHEPDAKIVEGFTNIMPELADQMTDEQIIDLIEFIKSLK
ncbi:MAG: cytochrome c oxidase subunit II [Chloroflexi bacterium]|nr:MAG: cytochrome c oxidase subunit II [Chloroflexota bacterium]